MPPAPRRLPRHFAIWFAALAAAVTIGIYASPPAPPPGAGRMYPRMAMPAPDLRTLLYLLGVGSVVWFMAVAVLPALAWGARRVPEHRSRRQIVATAGIIVAVLFVASSTLQFFTTYYGAPSTPSLASYLPMALRQNLLPWVALVGVVAALEARRRAASARIEEERLRAEVAEQRLIALTGQLQPHFLFNTLQGISTLIHRDADAADEMLAKLSDLLRDLLRHRDRAVVSLADEVRYARTYLDIAQLRFADRLTFAIHAPAELSQATVPLFILQPLIENALAHGIGVRAEGGRIEVSAVREGARLILEVTDDGAGLGKEPVENIGLGNTRERLRTMYNADHSFVLQDRPNGGCVARVEIPYRELQP